MNNAYGMADFYYYYKNNKGGKHSETVFSNVMGSFFKGIVKYIYQGYIIDFTFGLGSFYIKKYKQKVKINANGEAYVSGKKSVDYAATKKFWKENPDKAHKHYLYYDNDHSDGSKVKLEKTGFSSDYISLTYNFKPSRTFSRDLATEFKSDPYRDFITI